MTRVTVTALALICSLNSVLAQHDTLVIQGSFPDIYINHTTAPKENYYSVGRMYNIAPREIATYNGLVLENGLNVGQVIKIPLTQQNFIQNINGGDGLHIPVYHTIEAREGLYRISVNYNKVPLEQLKKWNRLSSDAVSNGTRLIVGYLQVQNESSLAGGGGNGQATTTARANEAPPTRSVDLLKESPPVKNNIEKPETAPSAAPVSKTQAGAAMNFNGGAFKNLYEEQHVSKTAFTESGLSGVFKSTSGWRDGKYYCFHNSAPQGTILKITNSVNGRSIYAKVLDLIPDIVQNAGLILHISNAAAEDLGVNAARFDCSINYSK